MKIFAKKSFQLEAGGRRFTTKPFVFDEMPKEFAKCMLFQWAVKDGDIEIIGDGGKQKALENSPGTPTAARKPPAGPGDAA